MKVLEKAVSKAQQRYMAMVAAGDIEAPKGLTKKKAREFAKTKHDDLPDHVTEHKTFKQFLAEINANRQLFNTPKGSGRQQLRRQRSVWVKLDTRAEYMGANSFQSATAEQQASLVDVDALNNASKKAHNTTFDKITKDQLIDLVNNNPSIVK